MSTARSVVYVIGFGAPPVIFLGQLIALLYEDGWDPYVILSPTAASWVAVDTLAHTSHNDVRVAPRNPSQDNPLPPATAVIAAPLTFNSLNKWAAGISDTLALSLLNEAIGLDIPITAAACVKNSLQRHPAYRASQTALRNAGVHLIDLTNTASQPDVDDARFDWTAIQSTIRQQPQNPRL